MKSLLFAAILLASSSQVHAQENRYYTIESVNVFEEPVSESELTGLRDQFEAEKQSRKKSEDPLADLDLTKVAIDKIFAIGEKIWKVIDANRPVVNLSTKRASALPQGVDHWLAMENWSDLEARRLTAVYKNGFGMEVVRLSYLITYTHSGSIRGTGKYLSEVGFMVSNLDVAWGYTFNANAEIVRVQNVGTRENPIAGMELNFNWTVSNPIKHSQSAVNFYVRGDGRLTAQGL